MTVAELIGSSWRRITARGSNKEVAQLDGWLRDGSAAYVEELCLG